MKEKVMYSGAPVFKDEKIFVEQPWLCRTTHCFAYAVGDYGAGLLTGNDCATDYNYLPRPGEGNGFTYDEIVVNPNHKGYIPSFQEREKIIIQALKQEGILFQSKLYPKNIPNDKYVICCFLEPNEYHFIRQNADGSWTSKNGYAATPNDKCCDGITPIGDNPENFYGADKSNHFVGYFTVPKGGVKVGVKAYLQKVSAREFKKGPLTTAKIEKGRDYFSQLNTLIDDVVNLYRQKKQEKIEDCLIQVEDCLNDIHRLGIDFHTLLRPRKMISESNRIKRSKNEGR